MSEILGFLLLSLCGFVAGYLGAMLKFWGLRRVSIDLSFRMEELEGRLLREIKARAGDAGRRAKDDQRRLEDWARETAEAPAPAGGVVAPAFKDWFKSKMAGGGMPR